MASIEKSPFQFIENRVNKLEVKNSLIDFSEKSLKREIKKLDYIVTNYSENGELFLGALSLDLEVLIASKSEQSVSFYIQVEGLFKGDKSKINKEQFEKMLEINGSSTLLSIARGIVISISALCSFNGQIRIPLMNMLAYYNKKHNKQSDEPEESKADSDHEVEGTPVKSAE